MNRVLVTGASGFVGSHLCRKLLGLSNKILGTYRHHSPSQISDCKFVKIDFASRPAVTKLISDFKPHYVYHLAAQSLSSGSVPIEKETLRSNAIGTVFLLDSLRRFAPQAKLLLASSSHSYGKTLERKPIVEEGDLLWPENPYAVSKVLAELACREFTARFGIKTVIARSFNHIGAGQRRGLVFSDWCRQIALIEKGKQDSILKVGNLNVKRDFMHIDDVIQAYCLLMKRGKPGEVYNVSSRKIYPLKVYLDFLLRKTEKKIRVISDPGKIRPSEPESIKGSSVKIQKLGWCPQRNAFDAIEDLLAEWRSKVKAV